MTQSMNRDELARHLYIHSHDEAEIPAAHTLAEWQELGARVWDDGDAGIYSYERCYAEADAILSGQVQS